MKEIINQNINRYLNKVKYSYHLGALSVQQHNQEVMVKGALPYEGTLDKRGNLSARFCLCGGMGNVRVN